MSFKGKYSDHIHPDKLGSLSISIFLSSLLDSQGGVGANIAYSVALLGGEPVLLGSVGNDARAYMAKLSHLGVNTKHVFESSLPTASFNVITDSDENQVGGFYPGAMFDSSTLSFRPWKSRKPMVVISPHDPAAMRRQVEECRRWGLWLCYDIGQQVSNLPAEDMVAGLDVANLLIVNEYELSALSAKTGRSIESIKSTIPIVITTLGKKGSVVEGASVDKPVPVGIVKPRRVVDPTGAGDAYRAGLLFGLARRWDLRQCARLGATCATYAVEEAGTQNHTFDPRDFAGRYEESFGEPLPRQVTFQ